MTLATAATVVRDDLWELINTKDWEALREAFGSLPSPDVAEIIETLLDTPGDEEGIIFRVLPREQAAAVFEYLPLERQRQLVQCLSHDNVRAILDQMSPDDRTRLLE